MLPYVSQEPISIDMVRKACNMLSKKHPMLRMRLSAQRSDEPVRFVPLDNRPVEVTLNLETDWLSAHTSELSSRFEHGDNLLWRVQYLPNVSQKFTNSRFKYQIVLIITMDHSIGDGLSLSRMSGDLTEFILLTRTTGRSVDSIRPRMLPESMETTYKMHQKLNIMDRLFYYATKKYPAFCSSLVNVITPKMDKYRHKSVIDFLEEEERYTQHQSNSLKLVPKMMNLHETSMLSQKCRENGVSPAAAVLASYFLALNQYADIGGKEIVYAVTKAMSQLSTTKSKDFDVVNDVALLRLCLSIPANMCNFWVFAKACYYDKQSDIKTRMLKQKSISPELFSMRVTKAPETAADRASRLIYVANFGRCTWLEMPDESPVRLEGKYMSCGSTSIRNAPIFVLSCMTIRCKMFWNLSYSSNKIRDSTASAIADTMTKIVQSACL